MSRISNEYLSLEFDPQAGITWLGRTNEPELNCLRASEAGLFRLVLKDGDNWEVTADSSNQAATCHLQACTACIEITSLQTRAGIKDIALILTIELAGHSVIFGASVENRSDAVITDFIYPRLGGINSLGGGELTLIEPFSAGRRIDRIRAYIQSKHVGMYSYSPHHDQHMHSSLYPSLTCSMSWLALQDETSVLSLSAYDQRFYPVALRVIANIDDSLTLDCDRFAFIKPGERWESGQYEIIFDKGDWHVCARKYQHYAASWRCERAKAAWAEQMSGIFLVILKQQYGDVMWQYDQLPELYDYAQQYGCDTLLIFGWMEGGHDIGYPDLLAGTCMGGEDRLRENIRKVQSRGGHVIIIGNGNKIDLNSPFYAQHGDETQMINLWGTPYFERLNKYFDSEFLRQNTDKQYTVGCPSSLCWQQRMEKHAHELSDYGAVGVLFDQMGGMHPYACFHLDHQHPDEKPTLAVTQPKITLMEQINRIIKSYGSDRAFVTELVTDVFSQQVDLVHGWISCGQEKYDFPAVFRYTFPNTILTIRNPYPYIRPELANFAFLYGLRLEMEIRYAPDVTYLKSDQHPSWRNYAKAVSDFRARYWEILGQGRFVDEDGFISTNQQIQAKCFVHDRGCGIALWNDQSTQQHVDITVPGHRFSEAVFINRISDDDRIVLQPGEIALMIYLQI